MQTASSKLARPALATLPARALALVAGGGDWTMPKPAVGPESPIKDVSSPRDPASSAPIVGLPDLGGIIGPIDRK